MISKMVGSLIPNEAISADEPSDRFMVTPTSSVYYTPPSISFAGDFIVSAMGKRITSTANHPFFSSSNGLMMFFNETGVAVQIPSASGFKYLNLTVPVEMFMLCTLSRVGTVYKLTAQGQEHALDVPDFTAFTINYFNRYGANYSKGTIYNLMFNDLVTLDVLTYALDMSLGNTEYPLENLGAKEFITSAYVFSPTWSTPGNEPTFSVTDGITRCTSISTDTYGGVTTLTGLTAGKTYKYTTFVNSNNKAATFYINADDEPSLSSAVISVGVVGEGGISDLFVATATTMYVGVIATGTIAVGDYFDIKSNTVKEIETTNAITYVSAPTQERQNWTAISEGWGKNSIWNNTPVVGSDWTYEGLGVYDYVGDGTWNTLLEASFFPTANTYIITMDVISQTGNMLTLTNGGLQEFNMTTDYTIYTNELNSPFYVGRAIDGVAASCKLSDLEVREYCTIYA